MLKPFCTVCYALLFFHGNLQVQVGVSPDVLQFQGQVNKRQPLVQLPSLPVLEKNWVSVSQMSALISGLWIHSHSAFPQPTELLIIGIMSLLYAIQGMREYYLRWSGSLLTEVFPMEVWIHFPQVGEEIEQRLNFSQNYSENSTHICKYRIQQNNFTPFCSITTRCCENIFSNPSSSHTACKVLNNATPDECHAGRIPFFPCWCCLWWQDITQIVWWMAAA